MAGRTMAEIYVAVRADTSKTGAEIEKKLGGIDVSKAGKKAGDSYAGGFGSSIKKIAGLAAGVVAGVKVKNFLVESTKGYRDHAKVAAVTTQVIKTTGGAAKISATQVGDLADAIERKTGVDGDAILSGENLLLTFTNVRNEAGKGNQIFSQASGLLADMSVALGQDAKGSAIQLGKALNDPIAGVTALSKVGVSFTDQQKTQIKTLVDSGKTLEAQKLILAELGKEFGGAAAAAADPADRAKVAYHQLQDEVGSAVLPIMNKLATMFADTLAPAILDLATKYGPKLTGLFDDLTTKGGPLVSDVLSKAGSAFHDLATGSSDASPALSSLADSGAKLGPIVLDLYQKLPSLTDVLNVGAEAIGFLADHTDELQKAMPLLVAAVVAYKVAQAAANLAAVLAVPTKVAEVLVNRQLVKSNRELIASRAGLALTTGAETIATEANTTAKGAGVIATVRQKIATLASSIATKAVALTTAAWTGAQWLLNAALTANPIGLVIAAIALLVAGLVIAYNKSETFRKIVKGALDAVTDAGAWMWDHVLKPNLTALGDVLKWVWERGSEFMRVMNLAWDGIKEPARKAIAFVVKKFLDMVGSLVHGAAEAFGWVPGIGDKLRGADKAFQDFATNVNNSLAGIDDQTINVKPVFDPTTMSLASAGRRAAGGPGGPVSGPGTTTSDTAGLYALSRKEWVIKAKSSMKYGDYAMRSVNDGTATIIPNGGLARGGRPGLTIKTPMPNTGLFASEVAAHSVAIARPFAQQLANQIGGYSGPATGPGRVLNYRGVRLNQRTITMLQQAERILGHIFHITQGSYSTRVAASAGTHAGGGVMDTNGPGGWNTAVAALRRVGFASWHRTPAQGPWNHHIHSVAIGDPTASPAAKRQVAAFLRGGNGLGGMAKGGLVGSGIKRYDRGGLWPNNTLGVNTSGKTETVVPGGGTLTVELSDDDRTVQRNLLAALERLGDRPIVMDGRRLDAAMSRRALGGGY